MEQQDIALVGHSGFVGTTLLRQMAFTSLYRSANIGSIRGRSFSTVYCAAAPAQKWFANQHPAKDKQNIDRLINCLKTVTCQQFVLISTVDVFAAPVEVDEDHPCPEHGLHPYGLHRLELEHFVRQHFPRVLIVRLAGLVGPGLRKNVLYDLAHNHHLHQLNPHAVYQFYPMVNLSQDISVALLHELSLIHLTSAPLQMADLLQTCCPLLHLPPAPPTAAARYDFRSRHAGLFGASGPYQYSQREELLAIRAYLQSEQAKEEGR